MEGFTIFDAGVGLVILISALVAFSRGLVREVLSILGWVAAAIIAFLLAPMAAPLVREVPVLRDVVGNSCELSIIVGFAGVFAIALIVVSILTPLFSGWVQRSALGPLDQGGGFLFGIARGLILAAVVLLLYDNLVPKGEGLAAIDNSRTRVIMADATVRLQETVPANAPGWLISRFEQLTGSCTAPEANDAAETAAPQ